MAFLAVAISQSLFPENWLMSFLKIFRVKFIQVSKIGFKALVKVFASERFDLAKLFFVASTIFSKIRFLQSSSGFSAKVRLALGFFARFIFSGIGLGLQSRFFNKRFCKSSFGVFNFGGFVFSKISPPKIGFRVKSSQVFWGFGFQLAGLAQISSCQQNVQRTAGSLRVLQAFFWLRVFSTSQAFFSPTRVRR